MASLFSKSMGLTSCCSPTRETSPFGSWHVHFSRPGSCSLEIKVSAWGKNVGFWKSEETVSEKEKIKSAIPYDRDRLEVFFPPPSLEPQTVCLSQSINQLSGYAMYLVIYNFYKLIFMTPSLEWK